MAKKIIENGNEHTKSGNAIMKKKNVIKQKKLLFKYILFWIFGILGAVVIVYFIFTGSQIR